MTISSPDNNEEEVENNINERKNQIDDDNNNTNNFKEDSLFNKIINTLKMKPFKTIYRSTILIILVMILNYLNTEGINNKAIIEKILNQTINKGIVLFE